MKIAGKHRPTICCVLAILTLLACGWAQAQSASPPPPPHRGGVRAFAAGPDGAIGFVGIEAGLGNKTVTGAPFTASFLQSAGQTLADGNQIQRSSSGTFARDSQGRTRRDIMLPDSGPLAALGKIPSHLVLIHDPVAQTDYILDVDGKIARQLPPAPKNWNGGNPPAPQNKNNVTSSPLGNQELNGLMLQGTRTTRTIPVGAIGNTLPIVITVDRWYSPDLQLDAIVNRTDPRMGTTSFQLTNIQRQEPDASLFQVPAGYTVKQTGSFGRRGKHGPPNPPPN